MPNKARTKVIKKSVLIDRPQDVTYKLFTEEIGEWWPDNYSVTGPGSSTVIELRKGGRIFQRSTTGQEFELGKVKVLNPPDRLIFTWKQPQWDGATEVEVTFAQEGDATRVDLEHRGWEKIGKWGDDFRKDYDIGWDDILPGFVSHSTGKRKSMATRAAAAGPSVVKADVLSAPVKRVLANPPADGLLVHSIHGDVAKDAGVREGDVIVSFAGTPVPAWSDYYKVHCSITNAQIVPLVVIRGSKRLELKTPRTWIGGASAPFWEVKKGQSVPLRPRPTKHAFDLAPLGNGPIETWYRHTDLQGKKIGYAHQVWRLDGRDLEFTDESGYKLMGSQHSVISARISPGMPPTPIESHAQDLVAGRTVDALKRTRAKSPVWRSDISGTEDRSLVVDLPKDAMLATAGHAMCAFMTRREGATWAWTPIDEFSGRVGLPVATVCRGVEKVKRGRSESDAWRFDVVRVGRTLTTLWVSEESVVVKVRSRGGVLLAVDRGDAVKGVASDLMS